MDNDTIAVQREREEKKVARQTGRKSLNRNEKKRTMNDKYELDHSLYL